MDGCSIRFIAQETSSAVGHASGNAFVWMRHVFCVECKSGFFSKKYIVNRARIRFPPFSLNKIQGILPKYFYTTETNSKTKETVYIYTMILLTVMQCKDYFMIHETSLPSLLHAQKFRQYAKIYSFTQISITITK